MSSAIRSACCGLALAAVWVSSAAAATAMKNITVDEVTNAQITVSPDHKTLLADIQGLIYATYYKQGPTWNPDGKQLDYITDRNGIENVFIHTVGDSSDANDKRWLP